ncbi:hypothetical protein QTG54_013117 [Skeletonema marinoi]|uniref:Uncharacterized protein n=1 Tax=Skeletonema marinoi TaxID=267567 RepID=A0AAD8XY20_9STRA|nr:hypothetical protein QTG54_013117 [Skeletonema marinoi]
MQHQSVQDLHVQRHTQVQPSTLVSTPLSFLARTSATTSMSKLFARGPGRPSAASLEEEEDDDLGFEDEEDAEEVEAEEVFDDLIEIGDEDVDDEEFDIQMEGDEEYYDEEEGYVEEEEEDESSVSTDIWASYDAINEDAPVPLMDDPESDTNYQLAKQSVLAQIEARKQVDSSDFQPAAGRTFQDILNGMTDEEREELERDVDLDEVEALLSRNNMMLTAADRDELSSFDLQELDDITSDENGILSEKDLNKIIIEGEDGTAMIDPKGLSKAKTFEDMSLSEKDLKDLVTKDSDGNNVINPKTLADEFPSGHFNEDEGKVLFPKDNMFTEKDLEDLDNQLTAFKSAREKLANQTFYGEEHTMAYMDIEKEWPLLSNQTQEEILEVMENSNTMACPEPENWLVYDLNFNVTNLILASFKHNGEAPIMFTQWMPQLEVYERYASQRAKKFEWTWDDVEQADMDELKRYYKGIGYDHIPTKNPGETGVITLDTSPMDDEEREMLALENWMDEVYNEESDNLLFDDENFEPRDNVFDPDYGTSSSDKSSAIEEKFMKEYDAFEREFSEESQEWRDQFATVERYGNCRENSLRFKEEFDKAVFVETRVLGHARPEDNVFEVWLESFEIDLLHSKRQAFINSKLWTGPSEVDDKQLDYLVEEVRYLISDDSRYSYRMSDFTDIKL